MLNVEQTNILEEAIFLLLKLRNEQSIDNWETARARELARPFDFKEVTQDTINDDETTTWYGVLEFTEKEILTMPKSAQKYFRLQGKTVHYRTRKGGRYKCSYEARYAKKPYNNPPISVSASTIAELKARFIEALHCYVPNDSTSLTAMVVPKDFHGFALYWFENFHKAKVKPEWYKNTFYLYERHIKKPFEKFKIKDITPAALRQLLSNLPGNGKTEDDVHSILNQIFDTAMTHGLIKVNPVKLIPHLQHECETGVEFSVDEEITLLNVRKGTVYEIIFSVYLYAGLRPGEYKTAQIDGNFIVAVNSKQKNGKVEYKKIPICTHLRERLNGLTELPNRNISKIRVNFKKIFPNHSLKDLRKTFNTRCIECKVDTFARKKFMGHSVGKLDKTYTGSLDDYLIRESKKLDDWYNNTPNYPK